RSGREGGPSPPRRAGRRCGAAGGAAAYARKSRMIGRSAELTIAHGAVAKTVAQLLAQLRATPRSRMASRAAGQRLDQASESRPWEIKAPCPGAKQLSDDKITAADVITFIEQTCFVPEGKFIGQKLEFFDCRKI